MEGIAKIKERILEEAKEEKQNIIENAKAQAQDIKKQYEQKAKEILNDILDKASKTAEEKSVEFILWLSLKTERHFYKQNNK